MSSSLDSDDEWSVEELAPSVASSTGRSCETPVRRKRKRKQSKRHPVWEFFTDANGCSSCNLCAYTSKGSYSTTLLHHLVKKHPVEHRSVVVAMRKQEEMKAKSEKKQPKLDFAVIKATKYSENSVQKKEIDECLALFAGGTSFAYRLVENDNFIRFVLALNPHYKLPCRETLKKFVSEVVGKIKANIQKLIDKSRKVNICADIWTQKNMVASYLAVTAHFYSYESRKLENVCLAVRQMASTHTAHNIKTMIDEILAEYGLDEEKVFRFRTDNGSNMVAAFRESLIEVTAELVDCDFPEPSGPMSDSNLEESFDEFAEFDQLATEFRRVFPKWMDCFAHSLQLPLRAIIDKDPDLASVRKEVFALLSKFNRSESATRSLIEKCGKKLVLPGMTRWNTLCLTYGRLLDVRDSVDLVCVERGWSTLGETYEKVHAVRNLLQPFLEFTDFLQGEKYPTISNVIPTLLSLLLDIESPQPPNRWELLGDAPALLATELRRRFSHILGFKEYHVEFDSSYLISTFLDPTTVFYLSNDEQKLAKRELLIMMSTQSEGDTLIPVSADTTEPARAPVASRYARLAEIALSGHRLGEAPYDSVTSIEDEVDLFMNKFARNAPYDTDAINFWKVHQDEFPKISVFALNLLAIPATSAAVERVFSQATLATAGRKCQTGSALLETECLMKYNRNYYKFSL